MLRRLKTDVEAQLPEKIEKVLKCDMSAYQRRMTEMLRESGVLLVRNDDGKVSHKSLSNTLMQLRKVANHPFLMPPFDQYEPPRDESLWRASGKFDLLDRILPKLKEAGHRVRFVHLVFTTIIVINLYTGATVFSNDCCIRFIGSLLDHEELQILEIGRRY